jgi:hypothetical protein
MYVMFLLVYDIMSPMAEQISPTEISIHPESGPVENFAHALSWPSYIARAPNAYWLISTALFV